MISIRSVGRLFDFLQEIAGGEHPHLRIVHFQWLAVHQLYRDLRKELNSVAGRVLDVGCGKKPYGIWIPSSCEHVGIDMLPGPKVDHVIEEENRLPFPDESFDVVLSTQVFEHVKDSHFFCSELIRVLKPGGKLIFSAPFCYNQHGAPRDFRRVSVHGVHSIFSLAMEIQELREHGAIGSTLGILWLNWLHTGKVRRAMALLFFPIYIIAVFTINVLCCVIDYFDKSRSFYHNVFLVGIKKSADSPIIL